jgi:hypothetical protein
MKNLICLVLILSHCSHALGSDIRQMVIGKYEEGGVRDDSSGKTFSRIQTVVVLKYEEMPDSLVHDIENAKPKNVEWYMYDSIPVYFINEHGKVVIGLEYWPVTKPHGGFRKIQIRQIDGIVSGGRSMPEKTGYILPQLARFIDSNTPEGFVWPSKGEAANTNSSVQPTTD